MANSRRYKTEPEVAKLLSDLSRLLTGFGSTGKLSSFLSEIADEDSTISLHRNRLNGLLNGIKTQAVNEKTFKALSDCLQKINITEHENTQLQNSVRDNFAKRLSVGKTESEAIAIINRETALPVGAIMSLCLVKNDDSAIKTLAGPD